MARGRIEHPDLDLEARPAKARPWLPGAVVACALAAAFVLVLAYHAAPLAGVDLLPRPLPSVLLQRAEAEFAAADFSIAPEVTEKARQAALDAPLEATPFYYFAMGLSESRDAEKVIELLDETLIRDPRHYYARLWRARMYFKTDRPSEAIAEIERVISLDSRNSNNYMDALVDLARDPRSHSYLLKRVAEAPPWSVDFIRRANAELSDEDFLLALTSKSATALNDYVAGLVSKGEYERAFLIWQASLSEDELLSFSWPTNPRFRPKADPGPFAWAINSSVASLEEDGMSVYYSGRGEKAIASQTIMLGPGYAYKLAVEMSGDVDPRGGRLEWRLRCVPSGEVVATLEVEGVKNKNQPYTTRAVVPEEGCGVQTISLSARPGEYPFPARLTVSQIEIREDISLEESAVSSSAAESTLPAHSSRPGR